MKLVDLDTLFTFNYGTDLELNKLKQKSHGVRFVSRTRKNNGVSAIVEPCGIAPNPANTISVALGSSSVLFSFLQEQPYYSGRDIAYLTPKFNMTKNQMLYYCLCIRANRFRYNFGRQANRTLEKLQIPNLNDIPHWVNDVEIKDLSHVREKFSNTIVDESKIKYKVFNFLDIFRFVQESKHDSEKVVNLVSALTVNNGIKEKVSTDTYINGNRISISTNGIYTGTAFYQEDDFTLQDNAAVDVIGVKLNKYLAMYLITMINNEKFRFNYGRKSGKLRLEHLKIRLPIDNNEKPNWNHMEKFIKTLPYTKDM